MKLPLAYYGDPVLREKASPVKEITSEIRSLIEDMRETMHAHDGIGLAAPQVHESIALFITEVPVYQSEDEYLPGTFKVYINPVILERSKETWIRSEGCLSIPKVYGEVARPIQIRIQATNLEGKLFEEELSWLEARAFLHENDHINGVLFIDRIQGKKRQELGKKLNDIKKTRHKK